MSSASTDPSVAGGSSARRAPTACFSVLGHAEPSLVPRVLELFAKRGVVPGRLHADLLDPERMSIDLQADGLDAGVVDHIAACMRAMPSVETVLTSLKTPSMPVVAAPRERAFA